MTSSNMETINPVDDLDNNAPEIDLPDVWAQLSGDQENLGSSETQTEREVYPKIEFIDEGKWNQFLNRIDRNKRENQVLIDIYKATDLAGGCSRLLKTISDDWRLLIDTFEDGFPNFSVVADLLRDFFALSSIGDRRIHFPPLLLVGEAGVGKTEAARWLSENLGLPFKVIDMATAQTGAALSGSEKFWANTRVGQLFEVLAYERFANPLIVLDELDKVVQDTRYDPLASLYTLLEPSSARNFTDLSIGDFDVNASHINWVATANELSNIPLPILSRFTVVDVCKPTEEQAAKIILSIYKRLLRDSTWGDYFNSELSEEVIDALVIYPPRTAKNILHRALGASIRNSRYEVHYCDLTLPKSAVRRSIGFMTTNNP